MIRAILAGTKTQTRRIFSPERIEIEPREKGGFYYHTYRKQNGEMRLTGQGPFLPRDWLHYCPFGQPGDHLWVRETFAVAGDTTFYRTDVNQAKTVLLKWKPSIHMPRGLSRITLEITEVRVERLQEISEDDALAEGITWPDRDGQQYRPPIDTTGISTLRIAAERFSELWDSINAKRGHGWDTNPWVWIISFRKL